MPFFRLKIGLLAVLTALLFGGCQGREAEADLFSLSREQAEEAPPGGQDASEQEDASSGQAGPLQADAGGNSSGGQGQTGAGQAAVGQAFSNGQAGLSLAGTDGTDAGQAEPAGNPAEPEALCVVHICGAVMEPGVYALPADGRVMDAVTAAGGFSPDAAQDARNLAEPIADGSRIYILTEEEAQDALAAGALEASVSAQELPADKTAGGAGAERGGTAAVGDGKVNLNTADATALKTLPGIGDSRAAAILEYREAHGPFGSTEEIMNVSGIKQAAYDKIKDKITV